MPVGVAGGSSGEGVMGGCYVGTFVLFLHSLFVNLVIVVCCLLVSFFQLLCVFC